MILLLLHSPSRFKGEADRLLHLQPCALMLLYFHPCSLSESSLLKRTEEAEGGLHAKLALEGVQAGSVAAFAPARVGKATSYWTK